MVDEENVLPVEPKEEKPEEKPKEEVKAKGIDSNDYADYGDYLAAKRAVL